MTCSTLILSTDLFGAPYPAATAAISPAGRLGIVPASGTLDVAGVPLSVAAGQGGGISLSVEGKSAVITGRPPNAVALRAARFRSMTHVVVVDDPGSTAARPVSLFLFSATGVTDRIVFGPYTVPAGVQLNLADGSGGRLLLIWHDLLATSGTGKSARVCRTDVAYTGSDALVVSTDRQATNLVAARVNSAAGTITLVSGAVLTGPDSLQVPTNAPNLQGAPFILRQGRLSVTPNTVTMSDTVAQTTVTIENSGNDLLEVSPLEAIANLTLTPSRTLPACLTPGESVDVLVRRTGTAGVNGTISVQSSPPAATPAQARITFAVAQQTPDPLLLLSSTSLTWPDGVQSAITLTLRNRGNIPLSVTVSAPGQGFSWSSALTTPNTPVALAVGGPIAIEVRPPAMPASATITVAATDAVGQPITGSPFTVTLTSGASSLVNPGELVIGSWVIDPPGPDILPEGEYIELTNATTRALDLTGVRMFDQTFSNSTGTVPTANPVPRRLFAFGATTLNGASRLPVGGTVRILTRAKAASDRADDFAAMPWRVYLGLASAVWNNTGDTAAIGSADDILLDFKVMQRTAPSQGGGPAIPPGALVSPPRRVPGLSRRIIVRGNADFGTALFLEDGDLVVVRDASGTVALGGAFNAAGNSEPQGQAGPGAVETPIYILFRGDRFFPLAGAPVGALIARVRQGAEEKAAFLVGKGTSFQVFSLRNETSPIMVEFGINDCFTEDNSGEYQAFVDVFRG